VISDAGMRENFDHGIERSKLDEMNADLIYH